MGEKGEGTEKYKVVVTNSGDAKTKCSRGNVVDNIAITL